MLFGCISAQFWSMFEAVKDAAPLNPMAGSDPLLADRRSPALSPGLLAMVGGAFFFSLMALIVKLLKDFGASKCGRKTRFWRLNGLIMLNFKAFLGFSRLFGGFMVP